MDKKTLLSHSENIINNASYRDFLNDNRVQFKRNGVECILRIHGDKWFWKWFEGYVRIQEQVDFAIVTRHNLDEEEYNHLKELMTQRIKKLKNDKLQQVFPDANRNTNINDILT